MHHLNVEENSPFVIVDTETQAFCDDIIFSGSNGDIRQWVIWMTLARFTRIYRMRPRWVKFTFLIIVHGDFDILPEGAC